ncbi:MAG: hypothetical protein E7066_09650 [Lentimicrobiaceae bacterium]|nr:hypothetical protein [Lentimicrobiaceae bacterium]
MNKSTEKALNLIADRLWNGHASLFVGAGFSKNAKLNSGAKLPPDWSQLGDMFFERIRGRKPRHTDRAYMNVLRLAEEVECTLGRDELTKIIINAICDKDLYPSDLFYKLLDLPWRDIYTTNYDTLLERTSDYLDKSGKRSYSLVLNQQDLGNADSPLLMKLHGDINDASSIVITEEDYRLYANAHEAMMAHIRHTIMMETLVLVGVSGNDPNFIQWLGWVKDVLNDKQRKLYLLTVDNVPDSLRKTYEKKNIIVVSLKNLAGKGASAYDNITYAVNYISGVLSKHEQEGKQFKKIALEWGRGLSSRDESIMETYKRWKNDFESYPGWLVLPRDKREYWNNMDRFHLSIDKLRKLKKSDDILFLNLFNWRIEKALLPMLNDWENIYLSVLNKYNPNKCSKDVRTAWINLKIALLRLYRQESWDEKWLCLKNELSDKYELFSDDQKCRFTYEKALMSIYRCDFVGLENILNDWPAQNSDPYWDVRRGALWAEFLSLDIGRNITKKAFDIISERLEECDNEKDRFFWAPRKVHAHSIWNCMSQANFSSNVKETEYARITWNELRSYDDIWYERQYYDGQLRDYDEVVKVKIRRPSFILGSTSVSTNLDGNSKDYRLAYSYFLYYEELGFPIRLPHLNTIEKSTLKKALSIMAMASPAMAESFLLRAGDAKLVASVFNRRFLHRTKAEKVAKLYDLYINLLSTVLDNDTGDNRFPWVLSLRNILPEILSRLSLKSCFKSRVRTFDLINIIYRDKECMNYEGVDRLVEVLMLSFSEDQIERLIPKFLEMSIANCRFDDCRYDPFCYMKYTYGKLPNIDPQFIENLFNQIGNDENIDKQIYCRLNFLNKCGALNVSQQELLGKFMWNNRDSYGFPKSTGFRRFAFLSFPHPEDVNPVDLFNDYIRQCPFPKIGNNSSVSLYGGDVPILTDIVGTSNSDILFNWDDGLLNYVCEETVLMWDTDKGRLLKKDDNAFGFSVKEEVLKRFVAVEKIIAFVLASNIKYLTSENQRNLYRIVKEFEQYGVPSFRSYALLSEALGGYVDYDYEVVMRMGASDNRVVGNCIKAIIQISKYGKDVLKWVIMISEYFRCYTEIAMPIIIDALEFFTEKEIYLLNEKIQMNLMIGLQRLYCCTDILETDDELTANSKMNLRMLVAPIVRRLDSLDLKVNMTTILNPWKEYYESEETCLDIRNSYYDCKSTIV